MRSREYLPFALLGLIAAFIAVQAANAPRTPDAPSARRSESPVRLAGTPRVAARAPAESATVVDSAAQQTDSLRSDEVVTVASAERAPSRDTALVRSLIRDGSPGTYFVEMLEAQEQMIMRWPERQMNALRVWIDRNPALPDWDPEYPIVVERAFEEWQRAGFPLRFDIVRDSADTEIQIRFITAFPEDDAEKLGMARKSRDQHGWLRAAEIVVATHDRQENRLPAATVAGIVRHEIGHALGLGHSPSTSDVMFPESRTTVISAADRATLHLLYILPPGSLK